MYPASKWGIALRALDDDPRVPVRHAVGLFSRLLLSSADLGGTFLQALSSWRWESGKLSLLSKRRVFSTAIKRPLAVAADVDTLGRWTTQPRPCEPACSRSRPRLCCAEHAEPAECTHCPNPPVSYLTRSSTARAPWIS